MTIAAVALILGLVFLIWSANYFIEGATVTAGHLGVPTLLIGIVIVGFGTSAPEMVVSAFSSYQGNPGLALGNAYGSNIANIALILGITALMSPIRVHSQVLRKELPILFAVTALAAIQIFDNDLTRTDALVMLITLAVIMVWSIRQGLSKKRDSLAADMTDELKAHAMPLKKAIIYLVAGLIVLVVSSRVLVWGAVDIATAMGISDTIIGLTIVALGTSLPELAASIAALRRGEHDLIVGNVIGSNLFNTLGVVGIASAIHPMTVATEIINRDFFVMTLLTFALFAFAYRFKKDGRLNRIQGGLFFIAYLSYMGWIAVDTLSGS